MICDGLGKPLGEVRVDRVKGEKRQHGFREVFDIRLLDLLTSPGIGFLAFRKTLRGSLGFEF